MTWLFGRLAALLAGSCGVFAAGGPAAAQGHFEAGVYEGLMLAVDAQGALSGYFQAEQGHGVSKRCSFFLAGQTGGGPTPVLTWRTEVFPGVLQAEDRAVRLQIERGRDHPGCASVLLPQIASGISLDQATKAHWTSLRRVVAARSRFHFKPLASGQMAAFVVQGDVVGVLAESGDWLQVEYRGAKQTTTGWIAAADVARLTPP
jgi:hypothetical protein